ncbi:STY0301 family protein [Burkholderia alba]|uniref:STY0301 family protein n=1 Tax=Burkholderia alba TaxID=2683677 RepID=UPI002B054FEB|nr:STY0301 family protein [Burkholderia alba]
MSWNRRLAVLLLAPLLGCSIESATSAEVCPVQPGHPLQYVDVFDGAPEDMATLVPDQAQPTSGYWQLAYVYDAGRSVTVRCKYAGGQQSDVKLAQRVNRCDYRIDAQKTLTLKCK